MCPDCEARRKLARDALFEAKLRESAGHVIKGAAEMVGLKPKTARQELTMKRRESRKTEPK